MHANIEQGDFMYTTKGKVYFLIKELSLNNNIDNEHLFTTSSIAKRLFISRSLASGILNTLYRERHLVKINTRPVLYYYLENIENYNFDRVDYFYSIEDFKSFKINNKKIKCD